MAVVATAAVATVLILVGFGGLTSFESQQYNRVDDSLSKRPVPELGRALGGATIGPAPQLDRGPGGGIGPPGSAFGRPVLLADGEYLRLISGGEVVASLDAPKDLSIPDEPGFRTLDSNATSYRSLARTVSQGNLIENGEDVLIEVDDDGPGITADQRERVFERFERADTTGGEGSGLGLSLVRQQARLHGDDVTVTESPAGGARFRVRLKRG